MSGNGDTITATLVGDILLEARIQHHHGNWLRHNWMTDALYVLQLGTNLISVSRLCDEGYSVHFGQDLDIYNVIKDGVIHMQGAKFDGVY